ncbi:MAG: fibronectin type III domain-containing protein [Minisyncoccia bacterium]|jgi:hypothetical protein
MNKKALTFVEILVILGILTFLLSSLFIFLNPALIFRKTRDNVRYSDLLNFVYLLNLAYKELGFKKVFVENPSNMINKIYVSLPTEKCSNIEPPLGKTLVCSTKPNDITNAWLPINFPKLLYLRTIKVDPLNYPPFFYTFELTDPVKLSYILTAKLETTNEYLIIKGELGGGYIQETTSTLVYGSGFGGGTESGTTGSGGGTGGGSEVNSPPAPPSNLRVLSKGTNYIMVSWDPSLGATSYKLDLAYDSNFLSLVYSNISTNNTIYNFSNLSPSTTYHVRVKAINNYGESSYSYLYNISTYGQISYDSFVKGFTNIFNQSLAPLGFGFSNIFFDPLNSVIKIFTYRRAAEPEGLSGYLSIDLNGNIINSYVLNGSSYDLFKYPLYYFTTGILDQDNYLLAGVIEKLATTTINPTYEYGLANIILGKFDANLNSLWSKSIGKGISGTYYPIYCDFEGERQFCGYSPESSDTIYNEEVKRIIKTSDGILLVGKLGVITFWPLKGNPPPYKAYGYPLIIKTDLSGVPIYAKIIKIPGYEESNYYYIAFNDGVKVGNFYYLVGTFANTTTTTHPYPFHARDVMLAKMDEQGNIHWLKFYQISGGADSGDRIIQMLDGNLLITGTNAYWGTYDPFLLKVDLNGNVIKAVVVTPATQGIINGSEGGHDLIITSDNNYAMIAGGNAVVFGKFNSNLLPINTAVFKVGGSQSAKLIEVNHRIYVIGGFFNLDPLGCVIGPSQTSGIFMAKLNQENYLSGCACSGTSTIVSDITNQILTYTKTYKVLDYKYPNEPMYTDFSVRTWQTNPYATSTQYCHYDYGGYGQIKNIKGSYVIKPYIFNRFLYIFSKLFSFNVINYLFANLGSFLKY